MTIEPALYSGRVVHARMRPVLHRLEYRVFSILIDVDTIGDTARGLRLLSYNRPNLLSIYDCDHGPGDGTPLGVQARRALAAGGLERAGARILMLAYPRVMGAVFNPLTVYFGLDGTGSLAALIYEVNNTVGERTSYVLEAGDPAAGIYAQACPKRMYVSPFTPAELTYQFRVTRPGAEVTLGVHLRDADGGLLRTHFHAEARALSDGQLVRALACNPLLALHVAGAIHIEALRLYLKGVPLVPRHQSPRYSVWSMPLATAAEQGTMHA
jgi:hypothetical protein